MKTFDALVKDYRVYPSKDDRMQCQILDSEEHPFQMEGNIKYPSKIIKQGRMTTASAYWRAQGNRAIAVVGYTGMIQAIPSSGQRWDFTIEFQVNVSSPHIVGIAQASEFLNKRVYDTINIQFPDILYMFKNLDEVIDSINSMKLYFASHRSDFEG